MPVNIANSLLHYEAMSMIKMEKKNKLVPHKQEQFYLGFLSQNRLFFKKNCMTYTKTVHIMLFPRAKLNAEK